MYTSNSQDPNPVIEIETADAIGLSIRNQPTKADIIFINDLVSAKATDSQMIPIFIRIDTPGHVALDQLFKELATTFQHLQKEVKVAILAIEGADLGIGEVEDLDMKINRFLKEEEGQAIEWLKV